MFLFFFLFCSEAEAEAEAFPKITEKEKEKECTEARPAILVKGSSGGGCSISRVHGLLGILHTDFCSGGIGQGRRSSECGDIHPIYNYGFSYGSRAVGHERRLHAFQSQQEERWGPIIELRVQGAGYICQIRLLFFFVSHSFPSRESKNEKSSKRASFDWPVTAVYPV
jgi:hypothetical protein